MASNKKKRYILQILIAAIVIVADLIFCLACGVFAASKTVIASSDGSFDTSSFGNFPSDFSSDDLPEGFSSDDLPDMSSFGDFSSDDLPEGFSSGNFPQGSSDSTDTDDSTQSFPDMGDFDPSSLDMSSFTQNTETSTVFQSVWVKIAVIAVFVGALLLGIFSIIGLVRLKERAAAGVPEAVTVKQVTKKKKEEKQPEDPAEVRRKKKRNSRIRLSAFLAVVLVGVIVLQLMSAGKSESVSGAAVEQQVLETSVQRGTIDETLGSSGTVVAVSQEDITVPGNITVTSYLVENGDTVSAGDKIASIDRNSVLAAISDVEELIEQLDDEVSGLDDAEESGEITAVTGGTVVKVYAQSGDSVIDVMYENSALMLLSADGLLAVSVPSDGTLYVGDELTVTDSSGETAVGKVADVEKDQVIVTVSLEDCSYQESVIVSSEDGTKLGSGELYIYSQLKVTGYTGTVNSVKAAEGETVESGDTLLTLTDMDTSGELESLLAQRETLVEQKNRLIEIASTGYLCADKDGVISDLNTGLETASTEEETADAETTEESDTDTAAESTSGSGAATVCSVILTTDTAEGNSSAQTDTAEQGNTDQLPEENSNNDLLASQNEDSSSNEVGGQGQPGELPDGADSTETSSTTKTVNLIWLDASGNAMMMGQPSSVTVAVMSGDTELQEKTVSLSSGWSATFTDLTSGNTSVVLKSELTGYSITSCTYGSITNLVIRVSSGSSDSSLDIGTITGDFSDFTGSTTTQSSTTVDLSGLTGIDVTGSIEAADTAASDYTFAETTIGTLMDRDSVTIDITVDEQDIGKISVGTETQVTLDAFPGQSFTGTVSEIDPFGSNSGGSSKYTVTLTMEKQDGMLEGMNASVTITLSTEENTLLIPEAALVEENGKTYVYTSYEEGSDTLGGLTEVTTGKADGTNVEILSGLEEGQSCWYRYAGTIVYTFKNTGTQTTTE